eukprot:6182139-Amphidinium_carterae.1
MKVNDAKHGHVSKTNSEASDKSNNLVVCVITQYPPTSYVYFKSLVILKTLEVEDDSVVSKGTVEVHLMQLVPQETPPASLDNSDSVIDVPSVFPLLLGPEPVQHQKEDGTRKPFCIAQSY